LKTALILSLSFLLAWVPGSQADERERTAVPVAEGGGVQPTSWLGVWLDNAVDGGVRIVSLHQDGPAQRASLQIGDVIIEANGRAISGQPVLGDVLRSIQPGQQIELSLLRGGDVVATQVEVGDRRYIYCPEPGRPCDRPSRAVLAPRIWRAPPLRLGVEVVEATPDLRKHYGAPEEAGVLVVRTDEGQLAEASGIRVGDIVVKMGGAEIVNARQLQSVLITWDRERELEALIARKGELVTLSIDLPSAEASRREREQERLQLRLTAEIERLERRLDALRRELEALREEP
jgi:S1-C subfamily serine protease